MLQAIERLNPQNPARAEYDPTRDYPRRHLTDYEERHKDGAARVVRSVWSLTDDEVAELEAAFGQGCLTSREVVIEKRYEPKTFSSPLLDEPKVLRRLAQQAGCAPEEAVPLGEFNTAKSLHDHIANLGDGVSSGLKGLQAQLAKFPDQSLQKASWNLVQMPKIMYFSNYDRMIGNVSIEKLRADIAANAVSEGDRIFQNFLRFAGTHLDELANLS